MLKALILLLAACMAIPAAAQVTGTVTTANGKPVPFINISVQGTHLSTASNQDGDYTLNAPLNGSQTFICRGIGYKTQAVTAEIDSLPHTLNFTIQEESYKRYTKTGNESISADSIIKFAISKRTENSLLTDQYEADYYSRGSYTIENVPRKLMGKKLGDMEGRLDSTGSGIIYLSETVSRIKYKRPDRMHERVLASKISGDDKGYSYNSALSSEFDFYQQYLLFDVDVVSPISDNAPDYYRYETESSYYDNGQLIHHIRVSPLKENTAALNGYIDIVSDSGQLYSVALSIEGKRIEQPLLDILTIKQVYNYNTAAKGWIKNLQSINYSFSLFDVDIRAQFLNVYSNYNLQPEFAKKTFTNEIMFVEEDANKKDGKYWGANRPIPLSGEELADYIKKDSIEKIEGSIPYLRANDSIRNHYRLLSPVLGHTYYNSSDGWQLKYSGLLLSFGFNTVQGQAISPKFSYTKTNAEKNTYTTIGTALNFGIVEQRFRATGTVSRKFNNISKLILTLSGGSAIQQFNPERPINRIVNSVSSLFFKDNYMKLYDNTFLNLSYEEEVVNGIKVNASAEYTRRKPLFNNTDFSTLKDLYDPYTSNNPLLPYDYETPAFLKHDMYRVSASAHFSFGQKYRLRPDGKENIANPIYPEVTVGYQTGFASSIKDYNFNHLSTRITYSLSIGQYGETGAALRAGKFFNSENIAFTDYRHFNGNRTHVGRSERYLNVFNLLPYYTHSTNDQYVELHAEHSFKGFVTNKLPGINRLNYHLVGGYHLLSIPGRTPYSEYTIGLDNMGWGKVRFLRIDYIRAYENGFVGDGVVIGLSFLDILE